MERARPRPGTPLTAYQRLIARVDSLQQRHKVLGFPYAVIHKYIDDGGAREAALITYYGFLSIFPVLLLGVTVVSWVLAAYPDLRQELVTAIVPPSLQPSIESAATAMPSSEIAFIAGLIGLLFSGTGVVFSAYMTVNHIAAVPFRDRANIFLRYVRVLVVLMLVLAGTVAVGGLTVVVAAIPGLPQGQRVIAALGSCLIAFTVLLVGARLLLARPAPVRALWPGAAMGAVAVTLMLNLGALVLPGMVQRAGPVYGSFATVASIFALLYLLSQALVFSAEVAAVHHARLWPRALDRTNPTAADVRALALLAREQERYPTDRIDSRMVREPDPDKE
jgi:uncharacterized BrkB/YihY/UPF0761 family membrane protein